MARCFISFDFDKNKQYRYLLKAWANNPSFNSIEFNDHTSSEINSNNIVRVKAALSRKIDEATHLIVIVGEDANLRHDDAELIGATNWQHWELDKAIELRKKIIAVKIDKSYQGPPALYGADTKWAMSFTETAISNALK